MLPVLPLLDAASPGIALGIAIGRVSDLVIGDHLGKPTTLPWGFRYPGTDHPLAGAPPIGTVVHPVALYDLLLTTLLLVVLVRFLRSPREPGSAIALFTIWYGTSRVFTDFLRTDPRRLFGLTGSQLASLLFIAIVAGALASRARRRRSSDTGGDGNPDRENEEPFYPGSTVHVATTGPGSPSIVSRTSPAAGPTAENRSTPSR